MAEGKSHGSAAAEEAPTAPAGTAPGTLSAPPVQALDEAAKRDYLPFLESSHAWAALTEGVELRYEAGRIRGPETGLPRQQAGRLMMLARNVLEANGFVVDPDSQYEPSLDIRVLGG
jgi:hypothetical protein